MDGNRRYGKRENGDPLKGHWVGGQTLTDFVQWCMLEGCEELTVFAFSSNFLYTLVGALLRGWLSQGRRLLWFNRTLALVLLATALWMLLS